MSLNAAALRLLAEKGLSAADIVELAEALEARKDPTAAERMRRYREKKAKGSVTRNVTAGSDANSPPNDIYSNPPELTPDNDKSLSSPKPKRAKPEHPLADDWQPILTEAAQRVVDGWPPGWLETQLAQFRDHASDKGRKSKDWQAAFRKWLSNADEWQRQRGQRNGHDRTGSNGRRHQPDGFSAALHEMAGIQAGDHAPDEPGGMRRLTGMG